MKVNKKGEIVLEEKDVRKQIKSYLQTQGFYCQRLKDLNPTWKERVLKEKMPLAILWWNHQGALSYHGLPDMAGCFLGHIFWIEIKRPKGSKVSPTQELFITILRAHNIKVFVAFSFDSWRIEWDEWIHKVKNGTA